MSDALPAADMVDGGALTPPTDAPLDVPKLLGRALSSNKKTRKSAIELLLEAVSERGHLFEAAPVLVPYLWQAIDATDTQVQRALLNALRELILGEAEFSWRQIVEALRRAPDNVEALRLQRTRRAVADGLLARLSLLDSAERETCESALFLAAILGEAAAELVPALLARLDAPALELKRRAQLLFAVADLLKTCTGPVPGVEAALVRRLNDADPMLRAAAAVALRGAGGNAEAGGLRGESQARVTPVLLESLTNQALAKVNWHPSDGRELIAAVSEDVTTLTVGLAPETPLETRHAVVRITATPMYLQRGAREPLVRALIPALCSKDPAIQISALSTVSMWGGHARALVLDEVAAALEQALGKVDLDRVGPAPPAGDPAHIVASSLNVITRRGDSRCLPALRRVIGAGTIALRWSVVLAGKSMLFHGHSDADSAPVMAAGMRAHFRELLPRCDVA